jgi:hypothetical protein
MKMKIRVLAILALSLLGLALGLAQTGSPPEILERLSKIGAEVVCSPLVREDGTD